MIFIFYTRYKPVNIEALSRLKKRLPDRHPMYEKVCMDLYNYTAGFGGEERVDQVLRRVAFAEPYAVLPNLHLHNPIISSSQIDVLIGTSKYFLILEVKNWTGSLDFKDSPRQVIQTTSFIQNHMIVLAFKLKRFVIEWFAGLREMRLKFQFFMQ